MTVRFVTNDGVSLALHEGGSGQPVVFQHGLCGDMRQTAQVFPNGAGFRCLTLECRGHGASASGPVEHLSIATFADDIAGLIVDRGLGPCVIGGISMGAAIALRLAVTRPDLVSALILARPAWVTDAAPANMAPNALVGDLMRFHPANTARALFEATSTATLLAKAAPDNLASLRGFFTRAPTNITAELLCRIAADGPGVTPDDLARIAVPTLIVGTDQDFVHPLDHARRLAAMIAPSRLVEITPKGADPTAYQAAFQDALAHFLKGL